MKAKKFIDQKKEIIFYAAGTLMVMAIVIYLFTLIRVLSSKVSKVFSPPENVGTSAIKYNFEEYEKIFPTAGATSTVQTKATSTAQ